LNASMLVIMKIKHVVKRGNAFWFQRAVPGDLKNHYGKRLIRVKIDSLDFNDISQKAEELAAKLDNEFAVLRGEISLKEGPSLSEKARELLNPNNWELEFTNRHPSETEEETKAELIHSAINLMAEDDPAAKLALQIEISGGAFLASEAVNVWADWKFEELNHRNLKHMKMSVGYLIDACGDRPVNDYARKDCVALVNYLRHERKVSTATVRRNLSNIVSLLNRSYNVLGIDAQNPFAHFGLPRAKDAKIREEFSEEELSRIAARGISHMSHVSCLMLMQVNTGATVSELAGLGRDDVFLDNNIPFIRIQPHDWRQLKNNNSRPRDIPLVGVSLAATRHAFKAFASLDHLFPMYIHELDDGSLITRSESASAAINKITKSLSDGKTSYSFRHSLVNRLVRSGCPLEVHYQITGHALGSVNEKHYNRSQWPIEDKRRWLERIGVMAGL
jgi:integrase